MARRVQWHAPAVLQVMEEYPTDEINTEPEEKLARRIAELTGVPVHQSTVSRQLEKLRRAPNPAAPQVQREEEEIEDLEAEEEQVRTEIFTFIYDAILCWVFLFSLKFREN